MIRGLPLLALAACLPTHGQHIAHPLGEDEQRGHLSLAGALGFADTVDEAGETVSRAHGTFAANAGFDRGVSEVADVGASLGTAGLELRAKIANGTRWGPALALIPAVRVDGEGLAGELAVVFGIEPATMFLFHGRRGALPFVDPYAYGGGGFAVQKGRFRFAYEMQFSASRDAAGAVLVEVGYAVDALR